jgi:hypothetical protein
MAFYANSKDPFSQSLFSDLPVPNINFTNTQWSTTNALHFGVPIPALRAHVGKHIQPGSRRGGPYIVDPHGHNLLTALGLRGGHIQRNHNGICSTIFDGLREAQVPHRGGGADRSCKGIFQSVCPAVTDEIAVKIMNGIIPDFTIQTGHHSPDKHSLAGCGHLADAKTLNASKQHYHKKSTDFGFAVKQRQTEVKSDYRKKAGKLHAEYHQPGDATTFKSILNEFSKGGEVLGLVVGYSGEASSDVYRVADLVANRLASKHLDYARTSKSIAKAMRTQRICRAWGHSFAREFARVILDHVWDNLDQAPGSRNWGIELDADAEFNFFYPPAAGGDCS